MWNVPDDWNSYYTTCGNGHRYHMSEGGCGACDEEEEDELESLPDCQCGNCDWERVDDGFECGSCNTGPAETTKRTKATHKARIAHGDHIKPGDYYIREVSMGYYPNGARFLVVRKIRTRAPAPTPVMYEDDIPF